MLLFRTYYRHIPLLFNDVPQDYGALYRTPDHLVTVLYPVCRPGQEADPRGNGGATRKDYRLGLASRQKYTTEQTLVYRFCSVVHRNSKLHG